MQLGICFVIQILHLGSSSSLSIPHRQAATEFTLIKPCKLLTACVYGFPAVFITNNDYLTARRSPADIRDACVMCFMQKKKKKQYF
jgi:hypothetical protein